MSRNISEAIHNDQLEEAIDKTLSQFRGSLHGVRPLLHSRIMHVLQRFEKEQNYKFEGAKTMRFILDKEVVFDDVYLNLERWESDGRIHLVMRHHPTPAAGHELILFEPDGGVVVDRFGHAKQYGITVVK